MGLKETISPVRVAGMFTAILVVASLTTLPAPAQITLYSFKGDPDGSAPVAPLLRDSAGNLYGTTYVGGVNDGTVFKLDSAGHETILHTFTGSSDGFAPWGGLVRDAAGNLYGTTAYGGAFNFGTVFKITKAGKESVLYSFAGPPDGSNPYVGLILDPAGTLYGATLFGGSGNCTSEGGQKGCGTVFEISSSGKERVLYSFAGGADGAYPGAPLVRDSSGNLYGATEQGGAANCTDYSSNGCGTVFKLSNTGVETILHSFSGYPTDGERPEGVVFGPSGNLYGATLMGGTYSSGTVFELTPSGTETLLYSFGAAANDGRNPPAGLVGDGAGRFYGTTQAGGGTGCSGNGCGTVFMITKTGREKVLAAFSDVKGGCVPFAGLIRDAAGYLYGTTSNCGILGNGIVFAIKP